MTSHRPVFVVVSGPPGSGKTTLATEIATLMRLPLLAKDLIKETLMSVLAVPNVEASKLIGRAAMEVMYSVASRAPGGAVLEANFHRTLSRADIQALPGQIIEVFCRCDREVALARYRQRSADRHPGHLDDCRTDMGLWNDEVTAPVAGEWAVIQADTGGPVDTARIVGDIGTLIG